MVQSQPILEEREWSLIMQLLENERHELPVELRHTDQMEYANSLEERRVLVESLIERLRSQGIQA
jgi:hypothetical protein